MDKSDNECEEIGGYGGAVHAEMNTVVLKMTLFLNKEHASKAGGVIQVYSGPVELHRCKFTGNRAKYHGGAISVTNCDVKISQSYFRQKQSRYRWCSVCHWNEIQ